MLARGRVGFAIGLVVGATACTDVCPEIAVCDIRRPDCQTSVLEAMACKRGDELADLPSVVVLSEQGYLDRIEAEVDPDELAAAEAAYESWTRGLASYDLAPPDYGIDDALADEVGAVAAAYFPLQREIVILDRGEPLDDEGAVEVFAHEIIHALQDRTIDLIAYGDRWGTSFDASLAVDAVIEGEAVHYQVLAGLALHGLTEDDLDWARFYDEWRLEELADAEQDAAPVALAGLRFPYAFGGALVYERWDAAGRAGIDALLASPPHTVAEILFGTDRGELAAELDTLAPRSVPALDAGYELTDATPLGAWIARIVGARVLRDAEGASRFAEHLAADVFSVQRDPETDTVVAAWRTRVVPGASAEDWLPMVPAAVEREVDPSAREALFVAADPPPAPELGTLAWRAPDETESAEGASASIAARGAPFARHRACRAGRPITYATSADR